MTVRMSRAAALVIACTAAGTVLANRTVNTGVVIGEPSFDVFLLKLYVGDAQGRIYSFDVF